MTHVPVLSAKVRRNGRLKWVVMAYSRHWQYIQADFWLQNFVVFSLIRINLLKCLQSSWSPSPYTWKHLHRLILLYIWHRFSQVVGYGRLYSRCSLLFESWPVLTPVIHPHRGFSPGACHFFFFFPISRVHLFVHEFVHSFWKQAKMRRNGRSKWAVMAYSRHWQYVQADFWLQNSTLISI